MVAPFLVVVAFPSSVVPSVVPRRTPGADPRYATARLLDASLPGRRAEPERAQRREQRGSVVVQPEDLDRRRHAPIVIEDVVLQRAAARRRQLAAREQLLRGAEGDVEAPPRRERRLAGVVRCVGAAPWSAHRCGAATAA